MAHNKLYRNFIILQEDEKTHATSGDKALSGYAKIEAKNDKCKISFYAQNLIVGEKYSIVLICYKKDIKQIVDLGSLVVKESGKGEISKEYYVNNIAGIDLSYEKISGAAVCKHKEGKLNYLMYGFMNGEHVKEDWKKCKIVKSTESQQKIKEEKKVEAVKVETKKKEECKKEEPKKQESKKEECIKDEMKTVVIKEEAKKDSCKDILEECKDKKDNKCKCEKDNEYKEKKEDKCPVCDEHKKEEYNCNVSESYKDCEDYCLKREKIQADFDAYENKIEEEKEIDPYDFELRGGIGDFFKDVSKGFEEVKNKFKDIKFCKWYKIKINTIDDMCNSSNYNKYTVAYYPMINYFPYIKKYGYYLLGYKCDKKGEIKYLVYGIPGKKDKDEQPFMGKTGFVTWMKTGSEDMGCWLMFYDYKKSIVVVPMK